MTRSTLDKELHLLDDQVVHLGFLVDKAVGQALDVLKTGDQEKAGAVVIGDTLIDDLHLALEEHTFRVMMLQQPLQGHDLRYLISLIPITVDLERIGDEAEGIAQTVLQILALRTPAETTEQAQERSDQEQDLPLQDLLDLGQHVRILLQGTMKAFIDLDAGAAIQLWEEDEALDKQSYEIRHAAMSILEGANAVPALARDSHILQKATYLVWIAHNLERVADHCTNVCERIVYIAYGQTDIHPPLE